LLKNRAKVPVLGCWPNIVKNEKLLKNRTKVPVLLPNFIKNEKLMNGMMYSRGCVHGILVMWAAGVCFI
uniref:Uncharacterized protein n=1 Tax=Amphimedon queenslandica TaxID=400682 RepID=A0A1X7T8P1_AMPQE